MGNEGVVAAAVVNAVIQPGLAVRAQCHPPYQAIKMACVNVIPRRALNQMT